MNENLNARKSLGIVKWFGGTSYRYSDNEKNLDYGFVKVILNRQELTLSDEFKKICEALKSFDTSKFNSFLSNIPENFYKYSWVFEKLPQEKQLKFLSAQFTENPTPQLEEKIFEILDGLKFFDWRKLPNEILLSDKVPPIIENLSEYEKKEINALRNQKFAHKAFSSTEILSKEEVLKLFVDADNDDKFIAFEKYCGKFNDDEIFKCMDELTNFKSAAEIVSALRTNLDAEENFPTKFILNLWDYTSTSKQFAAFEKYCTQFTEDEFSKCVENLLKHKTAAEIVEFIKLRRPSDWQKLLPRYILNSHSKGTWATWLLDNLEIFRNLQADEGVAILVMYAAAKENKISKELIDILAAKVNSDKFLRAQIVYAYFRAGYEKTLGNVAESQKFLDEAEQVLIKIFDMLAENPAEIPDLTLKDANIFPQCKDFSGNKLRPCFFCEAVPWREGSYCPRRDTNRINCARNYANLNLPAEDWALGELVDKFELKIPSAGDKSNGEYFSRIGGEFNRLYELRERLKCTSCGKYMRSDKNFAKWKDSTNVRDMFNKMATNKISHFAIFNSTVFRCENPNCKSPNVAYLSYCWHCQEIIDSRDDTPRIAGWYLCPNCGAGYREINGYAIFPATICPHCTACTKCGGKDFDIAESEEGFVLQCKECGNLQYVTNTLELQRPSRNKYDCEVCGERMQKNVGRKIFNRPMPWANYLYDDDF